MASGTAFLTPPAEGCQIFQILTPPDWQCSAKWRRLAAWCKNLAAIGTYGRVRLGQRLRGLEPPRTRRTQRFRRAEWALGVVPLMKNSTGLRGRGICCHVCWRLAEFGGISELRVTNYELRVGGGEGKKVAVLREHDGRSLRRAWPANLSSCCGKTRRPGSITL